MSQNLSKENFFNSLKEKYPAAVNDFCSWIDRFKIQIGWDQIFKVDDNTGQVFKFHDLPLELQTGIIGRYIVERMAVIPEMGVINYERSSGQEYRDHIASMFRTVQEDLEKKQNSLN